MIGFLREASAKLSRALDGVSRRAVFFVVLGASTLGIAAPAMAAGTATYDITPVVSGLTTDLTSNIPVVLAAIGALIALGIAVHMVKRWVRP